MNEDNNKKDIEVVQGIGNLDISPVYDNITSAKPKMQDEKPKNIVIPQVKKADEKNEESNDSVENDEKNDIHNSHQENKGEEIETEDLNDQVEEDSELVEGEQIEFEDINLDDATDYTDKYSEEDG